MTPGTFAASHLAEIAADMTQGCPLTMTACKTFLATLRMWQGEVFANDSWYACKPKFRRTEVSRNELPTIGGRFQVDDKNMHLFAPNAAPSILRRGKKLRTLDRWDQSNQGTFETMNFFSTSFLAITDPPRQRDDLARLNL